MRVPPDARPSATGEPPPLCTRRKFLSWIDFGGTLAAGSGLGFGLVQEDSVITALGAGATALLATSTIFGFATADRCRVPAQASQQPY